MHLRSEPSGRTTHTALSLEFRKKMSLPSLANVGKTGSTFAGIGRYCRSIGMKGGGPDASRRGLPPHAVSPMAETLRTPTAHRDNIPVIRT
jgi:hypothetical protein